MAQQGKQTAVWLSETDDFLLEALVNKKGVNRTSIIKLAIREMAEREKIALPTDTKKDN